MKRLFTALLTMIVVAPMLMATQCSQLPPQFGQHFVTVENKSDMLIDSLNIGTQHSKYKPEGNTTYWDWSMYKIKTAETEKQGFITWLSGSYGDQYGLKIIDTKGDVVADTIITLKQLPQDADDIKVILILEKTGELRIDKQPIKRAN